MKTSELTGAALDWAVAKCEGLNTEMWLHAKTLAARQSCAERHVPFNPSTDWAQGGPIIDKMVKDGFELKCHDGKCIASLDTPNRFNYGPTPLIAAMRCYVASKLGDEVEIPDELC